MSSKEKTENIKRDKYLKKKSNKRKKENLKKARAISRKRRNEVRNTVRPYNTFRNLDNKSLLFIMGDTDNMESVLLQKRDIGNNRVLLTLPTLTSEMVTDYLDENVLDDDTTQLMGDVDEQIIKDVISKQYSITVNEMIDCPSGNMFVIKDFEMDSNREDLIPINIRPYNLYTWYDRDFTSVDSARIYTGKKLHTFFKISADVSNVYVLQDTILKLLLYKAMMKKINMVQLYDDVKSLSRRGSIGSSLYQIMTADFYELYGRFKNETKENEILNAQKKMQK